MVLDFALRGDSYRDQYLRDWPPYGGEEWQRQMQEIQDAIENPQFPSGYIFGDPSAIDPYGFVAPDFPLR
jgi:hypothetical protein